MTIPVRIALVLAVALSAHGGAATAQEPARGGLYAPSVWDLKLGSLARELPRDQYIDFACGTNGGPPSRPLAGWTEFGNCRPEASGLREVYFQYDDEPEYYAKARRLDTYAALYEYTSVYSIPVIASALFDEDGFMLGLRLVTDPRVGVHLREKGFALASFLLVRFGEEGWTCVDGDRLPGEAEYHGVYVKKSCSRMSDDGGVALALESHNYRKPGQLAIDPQTNQVTEGQFESTTRFEMLLARPVPDRAARLAAPPPAEPAERAALVARARDCPGCDLMGVNLKRANLAGANLAGADLRRANLHAADLTGANLAGARLDLANLNRAHLRRANLAGASLEGATLYEAKADGADFSDVKASGILAGYVELGNARLPGAKVDSADLHFARMLGANLAGADFSRSALSDANLNRADLTGALMIKTALWRATLAGATLAGADLRGSDLFGATLREADLSGADLSGTRLTSANLAGARAEGARFEGALLPAGYRPPQ